MKSISKFFYYLLVTAFITITGISCNNESSVTGIKLDKEELLLPTGGTATLTASLLPYSATDKMKWSTGNSNVATVESKDGVAAISKGVVTATSVGTAVITVATKDGKHSATCTVTVINPEPELVMVEGGTFTMGCSDDDCFEFELPQHKVTLSSFKIAKYEVTQQQWEAVMGNNPSSIKGFDLPAVSVNWYQVQEFIQKLNALSGKNYRLPTEAEWEYAARGGNKSKAYKYSGSNDINAVAWYKANSGSTIHSVGTKAPNELGIYDMSGNVWEWCSDWQALYTEEMQTNPTGPTTGTRHIIRGGDALNFDAYSCRISFRSHMSPSNSGAYFGFRLVHP